MKKLLWFSRIFVGVLFIISGFIKANDPLGFSYKLDEYFTVFGTQWLSFASVWLSIIICSLEIIMGVALLFGIRARNNAWALLLLILFFTWLTGYSAITNKVTDCGCFGDALKLTPWQSFSKDLILLFFIGIIFIKRNSIDPVFSPSSSKFVLYFSIIVSLGFGIYCYSFLPVIDFLPYKKGNNLPALMKVPEGAPVDVYETKMIYQKDGLKKEFTVQNYPWNDSTWKWVETKSILIKEGYKAPIHDLRIMDADNNEYTDDIIANPQYNLIVVAINVNNSKQRAFRKINDLAEQLDKDMKIKTIALTSSSAYDTEYFRHEMNAAYPFYYCDATTLKTMIRSNPGLFLMKAGEVIMKWPGNSLPSAEELKNYIKQG